MSLYERVGGDVYFFGLVEGLYDGVEEDPLLRPIYPQDLEQGKANLADFLIQYWGGPQNYSVRRGHPRLRMRHFPLAIGPREREAWLHHMGEAVRASTASPSDAGELLAYFESASTMLVNRAEEAVSGGQPSDAGGNP
jgi:hemoglobin